MNFLNRNLAPFESGFDFRILLTKTSLTGDISLDLCKCFVNTVRSVVHLVSLVSGLRTVSISSAIHHIITQKLSSSSDAKSCSCHTISQSVSAQNADVIVEEEK